MIRAVVVVGVDIRECVKDVNGVFTHVLHSGWSIHESDPRIDRIRILAPENN